VSAAALRAGESLGAQLVNSHWYRVASLTPRLRAPLRVHLHRYRGQLWHVVEDRINGKYHRFDRKAFRIVQRLDGRTTLDQLWLQLAAEPDADTPSQDDMLALLGQLHALDLLAADAVPDLNEMRDRERQQSRRRRMASYLNPLALRLPLLDPDRLLTRLVALLAPVLNRWGALGWLAWVLPALVLAVTHWQELTSNVGDQLLAFDNLLLLLVLFPLVKGLHELGHGIACKRFGGEVHDMGAMLLLFLPVPYVEASSAWSFADKRERMLVGAAGMLVEAAIAALAFYLWLLLEPGLAKALAYDVAVLASVTTVLFNANPLLRYDGYYVAADALEIPNLAQRAPQYWHYLVERHVLGRHQAQSPVSAPGEGAWFFFYAPLSFAYRLFVMFSIAGFVATQYFVLGTAFALWSLATGLGGPLMKLLGWVNKVVLRREAGRPARRRVVVGLALPVVLLFALPLPYRTQVDGVLWLPDNAIVRARQAGFVRELQAQPGQWIGVGAPVARLDDPLLSRQLQAQEAREAAAQARADAVPIGDAAQAQQLRLALAHEAAATAHYRRRAALLQLHADSAGRFWLPQSGDLDGRFLREGQVLGYVMPDTPARVHVIVDQADADLLRSQTRRILVRLPYDVDRVWEATVVRATPAASNELPSAALGRQGGGAVAIDPRDESGRKALITHFEYELALPADFPHRVAGGRVNVRFEHAPEPLAWRIGRMLRRGFLGHFGA